VAVYVYAPGAENFSTMGLCGALTPARCDFREQRNGLSQLTLDHPIDDYSRWALLAEGCVLRADVPVRNVTEIDEHGNLVTTVEKWLVKTTSTNGQRRLYSKASGGKVLKTLPVWADKARTRRVEITLVNKGQNRYRAVTRYGTGWIDLNAIEYSVTETITSDPSAIEAVEPSWTTRPQLFRIRIAERTDKGVTVTASHIFYDLAGNLTTWSGYEAQAQTNNPTCLQALAGLLAGHAMPHDFEGRTNLLDRRAGVEWTRTGIVDALLAPDTGLVARWGAELVRDNFDFYVLREAGQNRGVRIEYGKNLLGVTCTTDTTDLITRIMPVGKTHKDQPLLLVPGTYEVNGRTITIGAGETWVTSSRAADHPGPNMIRLDADVKAASGSAADLLIARRKMIEAALQMFEEGCDQPTVNLRVEFVKLGDTIEYEQYRRLDDLYLCDRVRVRHPGIGVDVLTEVVEAVWDCLAGRFKSVELGRVQLDRARVTVPKWQLPSGIPGGLLATGTVDAGALSDDVGGIIDMSQNTTVRAMYVVIESSEGNVLRGQSASAGTTLTARVYRGGQEITGDLDAALFSWSRQSGDQAADADWAAAHAGVKAVAVTAAEFVTSPAVYHCDVSDGE